MKSLRWIAYTLIGLLGAPLLLAVLRPSESWYHTKSIWYAIQGLAPLFSAFFVVALFHVVGATVVAPSRKKGASLWAAIWTFVFGAFIYAAAFQGAAFWWTSALGSVSGALSGWFVSRRFLIPPNQSLQPTTTAVIPAAEQPVRQP